MPNNVNRNWNGPVMPFRPWSNRYEQPRNVDPRQFSNAPRFNQGNTPEIHYENPMNYGSRCLEPRYFVPNRYVRCHENVNRPIQNVRDSRIRNNAVSPANDNVANNATSNVREIKSD